MTPALALFVREWRIARRIGGAASVGIVFFLILVAVMPFALGPDLNLLARLGPAILWIAALLATRHENAPMAVSALHLPEQPVIVRRNFSEFVVTAKDRPNRVGNICASASTACRA